MGMDPLHRSLAPSDSFKPYLWASCPSGYKTRADPGGRGAPYAAGFAYQYVPMGKKCKVKIEKNILETGSRCLSLPTSQRCIRVGWNVSRNRLARLSGQE